MNIVIKICLYLVGAILKTSSSTELWERDLTNEITIGPTTKGYKKVDLKCSAEFMLISVEMETNFDGVLYIKGNYLNKKSPCFKDVNSGTVFNMKIPFDDCNVVNNGGLYNAVLILQHDDELIMPGDAAFSLECDFRQPKNVPVQSSMNTEIFDVISRIILTDADPSPRDIPESEKLFVTNKSNFVSFRPKLLKLRKEEL